MEDLELDTQDLEQEWPEEVQLAVGQWFEHRETGHVRVLEDRDPDELEETQEAIDRCWYCHPELAPEAARATVDEFLA